MWCPFSFRKLNSYLKKHKNKDKHQIHSKIKYRVEFFIYSEVSDVSKQVKMLQITNKFLLNLILPSCHIMNPETSSSLTFIFLIPSIKVFDIRDILTSMVSRKSFSISTFSLKILDNTHTCKVHDAGFQSILNLWMYWIELRSISLTDIMLSFSNIFSYLKHNFLHSKSSTFFIVAIKAL